MQAMAAGVRIVVPAEYQLTPPVRAARDVPRSVLPPFVFLSPFVLPQARRVPSGLDERN